MRRKWKAGVLVVLLTATLMSGAVRAQETPLQGFDDYVNKAIQEWQVPGLAIAILKDDKVVLAKGYGVRKLGETTPVDDKTMFAIGSSSKAFTAALMAMLVDEGKVKWDDPVTKHLPGFQLFDPYATRELTVRDLLCHRSGLERGDLLWYGSNYGRDEILRRIRYLKPTSSFRSHFGYQNIMFLAAGQIVAAVSGKTWDDVIRERIFTPLGMTSTNTSINSLKSMTDVATPHGKIEEKIVPIPWRNIDNIAPAGSINSNVVEMAQWVRLQLGEGKYQGARLLSSGAIKEMHMPQTIIRLEGPAEKLNPETHFMTYGFGWFLQDYRGKKVIQHGGNIDGMSALVAMMPEEKLGLVILTNMNGTQLPTALMYRVFDSFLQAPPRDWSAEVLKVVKAIEDQAKKAEQKKEAERVKGTSPSLALAKYAGKYDSEMYGEASVTEETGKLVVHYGPMVGNLEHWNYDTFRANLTDAVLGKVMVLFTLNTAGKVDEMTLALGPAGGDIAFKRAPDKTEAPPEVAMSEDELRRFIGRYELKAPPLEISVEMLAGKLKAMVPGQPVADLVPIGPTRFKVEVAGAPPSIFVDFELSEGKVKQMTLEQAGMKFIFLPKE